MKRFAVRSRTALALLAAIAGSTYVGAADRSGYLATTLDITAVVPPPPKKGDPRYDADRRVFRVTRALLDTPRGQLAVNDIPTSVPDLMRDFSCACGTKLSPKTTPATYRLLVNADADTQRANDAAKQQWKRLRPFLIDRGPDCQSKEELARSYDYPSGHTTHAWTISLILADLEPGRASQILARARAYGESRIVCGAHNMSAVEAGRLGATISLQQVRLDARYQADAASARAELQNRVDRTTDLDPASCSAEQAIADPSVLARLRR